MDMDTYVFQAKNLPMLLAGVITAAYVIYLVVSVFSFDCFIIDIVYLDKNS